jgi:hypothetical protein
MNADSLPGYVRVSITKDGIPVNHAAAFEHFNTNGESVTQKAIEKLEQAAKRSAKYFGIQPAASWAINPESKSSFSVDDALTSVATFLAGEIEVTK